MSSLLDIFMPEDLCARCGEEEPVKDFSVLIRTESERAVLHFCTERCEDLFVRGAEAVKELPDGF